VNERNNSIVPIGEFATANDLDREMHQQVYALHGLTPEEIKIIGRAATEL